MRKGWIFALVFAIIILFALGIFIGVYTYQRGKIQDSIKINKQLALQDEDQNDESNQMILTSSIEEKTSPNCTIVEKQYFKGCDHLIKDIKEIPEELINSTEEQIKEKYADWKLESFANNQIIVSQEKEGYCDKHYVVREHNGLIGIYTLNENKEETFKEDTEIATRYLSDEDIEKLESGISVIGDDQLHNVLEDFE